MIQSAYKPTELKAPESTKAPKPSESNNIAKAKPREKQEFKKSLKDASETLEPKVKPVEVSSDQTLRKPSSLTGDDKSGNPETVSPKVFDPALTEGVQNLIDPKMVNLDGEASEVEAILAQLTEVQDAETADLDMAEGLLKADMKALNAELGRAPSIELAQAEVDPQLTSMEDFIAHKNMANKKAAPQGAYGMKNPAASKVMAETDLKSTQVVKDLASLEGSTSSGTGSASQPVNSQQFILNTLSEQGTPKANDVQAPVKVFDMSQIKTADADKIMNQISDYIVQAKASKEPSVNMRMNHTDLGMIDITVMKSGVVGSDAVAITIGAHEASGKNFFQQNSKELFSHLTSAGVNVADMKVETSSSSSKSDFDMNQQNQKHAASGERQFGSEQNQRRHEQNRREELWKMFNKEAA